ncbi:MAG: hypothetical protein ACI7YS_10690 [Flavobacterium sp.]
MKKLLLLLITSLTLTCCEKDNSAKPVTELDKLPPATQTGAGTIGCLLDGKAFKPGYYNNSRNCFYQYVNGKYNFSVSFNNKDSEWNLTNLLIVAIKKEIFQGETYLLYEYADESTCGGYSFNANDPVFTTHTHTGELKITKLDPVNYIVSGTFWYDVEDKEGVVHRIRDGRFDMHYTN